MTDYPSSNARSLEAEFRRVTIDRQVDDFMRSARNAQQFRQQKLMVPSVEELQYRMGNRPPTAAPHPTPYQPTTPTRAGNGAKPSTGSPPPTPRNTGAGARTVMIEPPPTAAPRTPTTMINPTPGARPSGLPIPAGRFSPPIVGVVADIGFRMLAGQPSTQVVAGGAGNLAGTVVGSLLGGPVGGMVGGFAGGALADHAYKLFAPKKAENPVSPKTGIVPFKGGQATGINYEYGWEVDVINKATGKFEGKANYSAAKSNEALASYMVNGPLVGIRVIDDPVDGDYIEILCRGRYYDPVTPELVWVRGYAIGTTNLRMVNPKFVDCQRLDGQPDLIDPLPLAIPKDTRNPDSVAHPGNQNFTPPSAAPAAGKTPAPTNYVPGGSSSRTGGTPRGDSPNWVAPGALAGSPHPVYMPQPLAAPLPVVTPAPGAKPTIKPNESDRAYPAANPTGSPSSQPNAGNFSSPQATGGPAILKFPSAAPVTTNVTPTPDALQPTPKPTTPLGTGTLTQAPSPDKLNDDIKDLGLKLAGLTLLIKGLEKPVETIVHNTSAPALEAAVCRPTQPGGCSSNLVNNVVGKGNEDLKNFIKNNGLDAAAQIEQLRLLNQVDSKLGPQLTGGLAGKLGRMSKWLQLDRAWAMLTYAAVLHNAWMLSSSFGQTLLSATSSFLEAVGIKDEDGGAIDVQALIGKKVEETAISIFGKEKVTYWEKQYKKYVRVYQATANLLGSLTSIGYSIISVLEVIGSRISRIANALRQFGVVGDNAYAAMNEADSFQNPFFNRITRLEEAASTIDTVSSEVTSVRQTASDLKTQKKALDDSLKAATTKLEKAEALDVAKLPVQNVLEDDVPS